MALDSVNHRLFTSGPGNGIKVYQLDEGGLPTRRTADYVLGADSLYSRGGRFHGAGAYQVRSAYDETYDRLIVTSGTPGGTYLMYDVHPERIENNPPPLATFTPPRSAGGFPGFGGGGDEQLSVEDAEDSSGQVISGAVFDEGNQRLFTSNSPNNRIVVWNTHPEGLEPRPSPLAVLGQPDLESSDAGAGAAELNTPSSLAYDAETERLFAADQGNHRVVVFDVHPQQLITGARAIAVIGQAGFNESNPGIGSSRLDHPGQVIHDRATQRLFVADQDNRRVLVFDVAPERLVSGLEASWVLGQDDFVSREYRTDNRKAQIGNIDERRRTSSMHQAWGPMLLDSVRQRLFIHEEMPPYMDRELVFDVHPDRLENNPDAIAVLFADSFEQEPPMVSRTQEVGADPFLDEERGMLYVTAHYAGRNGVSIRDVSGEIQETGHPALDVLGQYDWQGQVDFEERRGNGRASGRFVYPRSVALDRVDNRLFVGDQYLNRVVMYELDAQNRILDRSATVVFGQPDLYTGKYHAPSARSMSIPLALAYDEVDKRLYVGDGWGNRVLVFDADPDRLVESYPEAIAALGQPDFAETGPKAGARGINFGVGGYMGLNAQFMPLGLTVDATRRRLFVTDGGNHRVLVFDIQGDRLETGAAATQVIGQPDFEETEPVPGFLRPLTFGGHPGDYGLEAANGRLNVPGRLAYDERRDRLFVVDSGNQRVLVFNTAPENMQNGMPADAVIGQPDFRGRAGARFGGRGGRGGGPAELERRRLHEPSSLAYDPVEDRLYVGENGNSRVLVFDASPENLRNDPEAIDVLAIGGPWAMEFDSEHRRLYAAYGAGNLRIFDSVQLVRDGSLAAFGMTSYHTVELWSQRGAGSAAGERAEWQARLTGENGAAPQATLVYSQTEQYRDPASGRLSQLLISETTAAPSQAVREATYYVDATEGNTHVVIVRNTNAQGIDIRLSFRDGTEVREETRPVAAGAQLGFSMEGMFGTWIAGRVGSLQLASSQPFVSQLLRRTSTSRGEELLVAIPLAQPVESAEDTVIAGLKYGGGHETELVLVNPHAAPVTGTIELRDARTGAVYEVELAYEIRAGGVMQYRPPATSLLPRQAYAVIRPEPGTERPWAGAVQEIRDGSLLLSQTVIPARPATQFAWIPVDTLPSLIRHGETPSKLSFTFANNSERVPALLRFTLFDTHGNEKGRSEQLLEPSRQREWDLADLFNVRQFKGTVRVWSDLPVVLSSKRSTLSIRGEPVENEISYLDGESGPQQIELPQVVASPTLTTEIFLVNPHADEVQATLSFGSAEGQPEEIALR